MDFTFTEDQLLFQESVRDFLVNEVTTESIRALWDTPTGRSDALWQQLAEMGLTGMTVPEDQGGLGMNAVDFVLLAKECGYVALPENLVDTALVAVPLLAGLPASEARDECLQKIASGEARIAVGHARNPLVTDAHVANVWLMQHGDEVHVVKARKKDVRRNESVDPSRRLHSVTWQPKPATCVADGAKGRALWKQALNGGALGAAAEALGLAQRMIDLSVQYTSERQQFGKPIGSFQAVKHHLANVAVQLEYAKAPVYRAAWSLANGHRHAGVHVSHAKIAATEAALLAAKNCIQVHGAMGYTWEVDLHIFMKRAWALDGAWGDRAFHKTRVAKFALKDNALIGAGNTFVA
ncbi:MAG TPA: acyl-CoA dehydrogenase family protein [Pseudomonadales bacterium]|jgi:alkylation response protein AidB-like acyl-CoA dehydrogenase